MVLAWSTTPPAPHCGVTVRIPWAQCLGHCRSSINVPQQERQPIHPGYFTKRRLKNGDNVFLTVGNSPHLCPLQGVGTDNGNGTWGRRELGVGGEMAGLAAAPPQPSAHMATVGVGEEGQHLSCSWHWADSFTAWGGLQRLSPCFKFPTD